MWRLLEMISGRNASSARLSSRTLTRGSPINPMKRCSVCSSTKARTRLLVQAARSGDRRNLRQRELRRNMRIEAGAGRRDGVRRHHVNPSSGELRFNGAIHAIDKLLRRRAQIGARGIRRVIGRVDGLARVSGVGRAGRRGAAVKITIRGKALTDQGRADDLAIALDHAAIGLVGKRELSDAGDRQRIGKAGQGGEQDDHHDRGTQLGQHDGLLKPDAKPRRRGR